MAVVVPNAPGHGVVRAGRAAPLLPAQVAPEQVPALVERLLVETATAGASDLHFLPTPAGLEITWRLDGVLHALGRVERAVSANVVARLKVLAELLTYRSDVPQEGRVRNGPAGLDLRVCTFPTLHGERLVVRLFVNSQVAERLDQLGLPDEVTAEVKRTLGATSGAVIFTGPAGSGKTTTLYACLREIATQTAGGRSLATLEDPVEVPLAGVAQSQVDEAAGFDLATGLRYLMRQDPEVIGIGEIRDRATAEVALQAALTGHLVLSTFHAGSAAGAISRLTDMGLEPYALRSGILAIVSQRLLRRLCECAEPIDDPAARLGLPVAAVRVPHGCEQCRGTGYAGRFPLAEALVPSRGDLGRAILSRDDAEHIQELARAQGLVTLWERACQAVDSGLTSPAEVRRVFGSFEAM